MLRLNLKALVEHANEIGVALPEVYTYQGETLFLKGERSNYIEEDDIVKVKKQFVNSTFREISEAGHW